MKISRQFADRLAKKIAAKAVQDEKDIIATLRKKAHPKIIRRLFDGKRKAIEKIGKPWIAMGKKGDEFFITFKKGEETGGSVSLKLEEDMPVPPGAWNGVSLDFSEDIETYDLLKEIYVRYRKIDDMQWNMVRELYQNIMAAKTDKALLLAWPEATVEINATVVEMGGPPENVEVPLSTIVSRYMKPALAAPAEAEVLEDAA